VQDSPELAERIADVARRRGVTVAVAESLTGGLLSSRLAAASAASEWFCGAVVAYSRQVKHEVLGVPAGPVVSKAAAVAMARGAARVLGADVSVALTGAGGPEPQDGQPPGTVWLAVWRGDGVRATLYRFGGSDPATVCERACRQALMELLDVLESGGVGDGVRP